MSAIASLESRTRIDLTAAFRWAARLGMHESIANHFSAAVSDDGKRFLLNPVGAHFSRIRASDLLLLDAADPQAVRGANAPDPTAWFLHAELHQRLPQARCILHTHMPHATALCCLQDFTFLMLDQNACRFHGRIISGDGKTQLNAQGSAAAGIVEAPVECITAGAGRDH